VSPCIPGRALSTGIVLPGFVGYILLFIAIFFNRLM
jgi:hypothetical protein